MGWRAASLVAGSSGVAAVYLLGRRLFNSLPAGLLAATFLLFEPLYFLQSRLAMLDIFPAAFSAWALALGLHRSRWSRLGAGLFLGAALASKYTAAFLVPPLVILLWIGSEPASHRARAAKALAVGAGLPLVIWFLSYFPYYVLWWERGGARFVFEEFVLVQVAAFSWNYAADTRHDYASSPWEWIPILRPVWYYVGRSGDGLVSYVYSVVNPATWWPMLIVAFVNPLEHAYRWLRGPARRHLRPDFLTQLAHRRIELTPLRAELIAGLLVLSAYLPFLLLQRIAFMYYATLFLPYLALLAGGLAARTYAQPGRKRTLALAYLALVALLFLLWYPLASGAFMDARHYEALRYLVPWMQTASAS